MKHRNVNLVTLFSLVLFWMFEIPCSCKWIWEWLLCAKKDVEILIGSMYMLYTFTMCMLVCLMMSHRSFCSWGAEVQEHLCSGVPNRLGSPSCCWQNPKADTNSDETKGFISVRPTPGRLWTSHSNVSKKPKILPGLYKKNVWQRWVGMCRVGRQWRSNWSLSGSRSLTEVSC